VVGCPAMQGCVAGVGSGYLGCRAWRIPCGRWPTSQLGGSLGRRAGVERLSPACAAVVLPSITRADGGGGRMGRVVATRDDVIDSQ
jgi:hypothetical protein